MKRFTDLYMAIDASSKTTDKVNALVDYFLSAPHGDAAWAVYFLSGRRIKRPISTRTLRSIAAEASGLPLWLVEECYDNVGDLAETLALLTEATDGADSGSPQRSLAEVVDYGLRDLADMPEEAKAERVLSVWKGMSSDERLVYNKLITGAFRVGVSRGLLERALSVAFRLPSTLVALRLTGTIEPSAHWFQTLISSELDAAGPTGPYPFFLANPLADAPDSLGDIASWQAEWKWDGIRSQVIRRGQGVEIWTRGEELATECFPEIAAACQALPEGSVLDGELVVWNAATETPRPFADLQRRLGRKTVSARMQTELPVRLIAYDVLELAGEDVRQMHLSLRRERLEELINRHACPQIGISPIVRCETWEALEERWGEARAHCAEGLMLKSLASPYRAGRPKGDWWKWKISPYTMDAVLIYAQQGHGKRAGLFTDYTFGVWNNGALTPIAKAYSGLTDEEIAEVDRIVRRTTLERHGPVRVVKPELVFELAFEGIQPSTRHKAGVAVRFPRMLRWRKDKPASEADTLDTVKALAASGIPAELPEESR